MTDDEIREALRLDFEQTADWRRSKAAEYPGDSRNLEAAALLDKLAASEGWQSRSAGSWSVPLRLPRCTTRRKRLLPRLGASSHVTSASNCGPAASKQRYA